MASGSPDYTKPATIASGEIHQLGGSLRDPFSGNTIAGWTALTPTAGRKVLQWTIKNTGAAAMDVGLGADAADMTLEPGESWSPIFDGALRVRNKDGGGTATSYKAVAVEK